MMRHYVLAATPNLHVDGKGEEAAGEHPERGSKGGLVGVRRADPDGSRVYHVNHANSTVLGSRGIARQHPSPSFAQASS